MLKCVTNILETLLVILMISFFVAQDLNQCQFKILLDEVANNYPVLILRYNVR